MKIIGFTISNRIRLFLGISLVLILCQSSLFAQISASSADYSTATAYTTGEDQNDIFVFSDIANVGVGELKAVSSDGESGWNFTWSKWNSGSLSFDAPFKVDNSASESTVSNLADGLYHVNIENGTEVRDYQAWVINHLKNTNQPSFSKTEMDCNGVYFTASFNSKVYQYSDYPSASLLDIPVKLNFKLYRDSDDVFSTSRDNYNGGVIDVSDKSSFEGIDIYRLTVTDECDFEYSSELIESETYVVDASFTFDPSSGAGDAPLEMSFKLDVDNATEYHWYFYKDSKHIIDFDIDMPAEREDLLTDVINDKNAVYTYMHPGKYPVKLFVKSDKGPKVCEHTYYLPKDKYIDVKVSLFEVPNVFTPNGDDKNDEFRIKLFSVKSYNAKIFNRWGRLVYSFEESDIQYTNAGYDSNIIGEGSEYWKSVKGWNGKINGKLAASGTYFYVVEAEGREEEGKHYTEKGAVMLLHNK